MSFDTIIIIVLTLLLAMALRTRRRQQLDTRAGTISKNDHAIDNDATTEPSHLKTTEDNPTNQQPPYIDEKALNKLVSDVSPEILPALIDVFVKELVTRCKAIDDMPHDGTDPRLRVEIHSLKSCARTFGAKGFAEQAALIEKMIDGHPGNIERQIHHLQRMLPDVLGVFSTLQSQLQIKPGND